MKNNSTSEQDLEDVALDMEIAKNKLMRDILIEEQSPMKSLYEWTAPERLYTEKTRKWYVVVASIAMLVVVYAALTANIVLIFLIIALMLVIYSLASIPPQNTKHVITNKGLNSYNNLYVWRNFIYFWVTRRGKEHVIHLEFKEKFTDLYYQRMILLTGEGDLKTIVFHFLKHIDYLNSGSGTLLSKWIEGEFIPLLKIMNIDDVSKAEKVKDIWEDGIEGNHKSKGTADAKTSKKLKE